MRGDAVGASIAISDHPAASPKIAQLRLDALRRIALQLQLLALQSRANAALPACVATP